MVTVEWLMRRVAAVAVGMAMASAYWRAGNPPADSMALGALGAGMMLVASSRRARER